VKFDSYYEFSYFKKVALQNVKDEETKKQLEVCDDRIIPDKLYCHLQDSLSSYIKEIKLFSGQKPFYRELIKDELTSDNIVQLSSFLTHISIGLISRKKIRDNVDTSTYMVLKEDIDKMINRLLIVDKTKNLLIKYLKDD